MPAPRVERVDARTAPDETLLTIHRIEEACADALAPGESWRPPADALAFMRHPPPDEPRPYWLAWLGDEAAGTVVLHIQGSSPLAYAEIRVRPEYRRNGVGRALLAAVETHGGFAMLAGHYAGEEGRAFARAVGAREEQRDVRSVLDLHAAQLPELRVPEGYSLRSWIGAAPDELVESFAVARNAVGDAPHPEGEEPPPWTVDRVRELEEVVARRNHQIRVTVALAADGRVVSYTEIRASEGSTRTEDTATVREHRGRGLALAVKTEALRALRADRPDVRFVPTFNAESNAAMRAVNAKLGFVPVATLTTVILAPR